MINVLLSTENEAELNKMASLILLLLLFVISPISAQAADCRINLSRPVIDYGQLVPGIGQNALRGSLYPLDENDVMVIATCDEPQKMSIFFSGSTREGGFAFGDKGVLVINASHAMLDGKAVKLSKTTAPGVLKGNGATRESVRVRNNEGLIPANNQEIQSGQQFIVTLTLKPLMDASGLQPADKTLIKSDLNIQVDSE